MSTDRILECADKGCTRRIEAHNNRTARQDALLIGWRLVYRDGQSVWLCTEHQGNRQTPAID